MDGVLPRAQTVFGRILERRPPNTMAYDDLILKNVNHLRHVRAATPCVSPWSSLLNALLPFLVGLLAKYVLSTVLTSASKGLAVTKGSFLQRGSHCTKASAL